MAAAGKVQKKKYRRRKNREYARAYYTHRKQHKRGTPEDEDEPFSPTTSGMCAKSDTPHMARCSQLPSAAMLTLDRSIPDGSTATAAGKCRN